MSADAWSPCPRCEPDAPEDHDGEGRFREDYEIWHSKGVVLIEYRGECQECGLLIEFKDRRYVPGFEPERAWSAVAPGDEVQAPDGSWLEVHSVSSTVAGVVRLGFAFGERDFPADNVVRVRRGAISMALDNLRGDERGRVED